MDVERLRREARAKIEEGALTPHYRANREAVLEMLNGALATEWLCVLRYTQHSIVAQGIHAEAVATHFAEHARQEQEHAMRIAGRMRQLGGDVSLDPHTLSGRAHSQYQEAESLTEMIKENLIAERIAIESYTEMIRTIGDDDPTTRRMLEEILAVEEEHADEMADLLVASDGRDGSH
jgi:bacterioferritin